MQARAKVKMVESQTAGSTMMRRLVYPLIVLAALANAAPSSAEDLATPTGLQEKINTKFRNFFGPDSQALLPLPTIELPAWKSLRASKTFTRVYTEPDKFYNSKVYTFTLYQLADDGSYYLDAKGGFWGMDELIYGPLSIKDLE